MTPKDRALGRWLSGLLIAGVLACLFGFAWFAVFVGLPYPDPTPEQYQRQRLHTSVSDAMMLGGIVAIAASLAARLIAWALARGRRRSR